METSDAIAQFVRVRRFEPAGQLALLICRARAAF
jgi:hypothetical protein